MSEIFRISKGLKIYNDVLDAHHGQVDGIIRIGNPITNKVYGYLEYSLYNKEFHINMINVYKEYQRKGYATILINYVKKEFKGYKLKEGYSTEEGAKLLKSVKKLKGRR
jgi:ribosomal protein S18 acetylase RimI-like enzyme